MHMLKRAFFYMIFNFSAKAVLLGLWAAFCIYLKKGIAICFRLRIILFRNYSANYEFGQS